MKIQEYFDKVYLLNLKRNPSRLKTSTKRLAFAEIPFEKFDAVDGSVMKKVWEEFNKSNSYFTNSGYLATSISHLSIYQDAISRGYKKILILEDDVRVNSNAQEIFEKVEPSIPINWDLIYLGYIPLTDDCISWNYNIIDANSYINTNFFLSKNLWGLFSYGISDSLMKEIIDIYNEKFPMEIDRYFVNFVQKSKMCIGMSPQLFCVDDVYSDNLGYQEFNMIQRSVDTRFSKYTDFI
jgi:GR25 family glycosyltransferase involved in LPS biosynthesis